MSYLICSHMKIPLRIAGHECEKSLSFFSIAYNEIQVNALF